MGAVAILERKNTELNGKYPVPLHRLLEQGYSK